MTHVADTHALVWFFEANARLSPAARAALMDPSARVVIPTIVLAEIAYLHARGRFALDVPTVLAHIAGTPNWVVYDLDKTVVQHLPPTLDIHDAIIVGTALVFRDVLGESTTGDFRRRANHSQRNDPDHLVELFCRLSAITSLPSPRRAGPGRRKCLARRVW
jgi:PIN domain nuclease of toxin-antitoxin system